jgi:hypothetical protein
MNTELLVDNPFQCKPTLHNLFAQRTCTVSFSGVLFTHASILMRLERTNMTDDTLHLISRLFLIFTIMVLAAACGSILAWPFLIGTTAACCLAVHCIARMGSR